jgi:hypothetical protein
LTPSFVRLHGIVFPRHFPYRVVHCKLSNAAIWEHFTQHPLLALNVRRLEILPEHSPSEKELIPFESVPGEESTDKKAIVGNESLVTSALANMASLITLKWLPDDAPPFLIHFPEIWPALQGCSSLKEIDVFSNSVFMSDERVEGYQDGNDTIVRDCRR